MQGLAAAGHELHVIAPHDAQEPMSVGEPPDALAAACTSERLPVRMRSWPRTAAAALWRGRAVTMERHFHPSVAHAVSRTIADWKPHVVHAEQLQALAHCVAARSAGIPLVLRMQNVESSLWQQVARARPLAWPLAIEARRVRRDERDAMRLADLVLTLTARDADALAAIAEPAHARKLVTLAPAFPTSLPAAPSLEGDPAIVLAGSAGWWPNAQAMHWFLGNVCPALLHTLPGIRVHVFGAAGNPAHGVVWHRAPKDAVAAFPDQAIAVVPLQVGSGIRMRILEAWARGLPVVASPVAAAGLDVRSGRELLLADSADEFVAAIVRLQSDPRLRERLCASGRDYLGARHAIGVQSERMVELYARAGACRR